MPVARESGAVRFGRRISVETPENVLLQLELAGLGSRMAAGVLDLVLLILLLLLELTAVTAVEAFTDWVRHWAFAFLVAIGFSTFWGYFALFEALGGGRTPGKRRVGIRVVMDTGHPVTLQAALVRNLVRLVDLQPIGAYTIGLLFVFFSRRHQRLGDIVAGTLVVRDQPEEIALTAPWAPSPDLFDAGPPVLSEEEFQLLDRLVARLDDLQAPVRDRLVANLARRVADRLPSGHPPPEAPALSHATTATSPHERLLIQLYDDELRRRKAKTATRRAGGGLATGGSAQRFVASRQAVWEAFRRRALEVEQRGLTSLTGEELTAFAADYRSLAADLARARTYGVDRRVLAFLERVVGSGHNALYGLRGVRRIPIGRLLFAELPGAAFRARYYVAAALLLFSLPGLVGYSLVRERPDIVHEILPDGMIARAESGEYQRQIGRGYAEAPSPYLPLVASSIVANNVQVAFAAFAFGVTAGVGTVVVLLFNGLFFGAVLGMFANYGLGAWLLTFVAGHGVLELTAIFMAGGAGLLVGRAIVNPGDLTRHDALVIGGRLAVRLVGAAACLLVLAGVIEGFLSASGAPAAFKLGVSAASAVLVGLGFAAGRRHVLTEGGGSP